mmetsp:Transcript_66818/g.120275  ORF Transcript_66818/g.120275 Transcript_66818/m.120275 type:complete len:217 (+) Transcript_66818:2121-2771(+)
MRLIELGNQLQQGLVHRVAQQLWPSAQALLKGKSRRKVLPCKTLQHDHSSGIHGQGDAFQGLQGLRQRLIFAASSTGEGNQGAAWRVQALLLHRQQLLQRELGMATLQEAADGRHGEDFSRALRPRSVLTTRALEARLQGCLPGLRSPVLQQLLDLVCVALGRKAPLQELCAQLQGVLAEVQLRLRGGRKQLLCQLWPAELEQGFHEGLKCGRPCQ